MRGSRGSWRGRHGGRGMPRPASLEYTNPYIETMKDLPEEAHTQREICPDLNDTSEMLEEPEETFANGMPSDVNAEEKMVVHSAAAESGVHEIAGLAEEVNEEQVLADYPNSTGEENEEEYELVEEFEASDNDERIEVVDGGNMEGHIEDAVTAENTRGVQVSQVAEDEQKEISEMAERRKLKKEQEIFVGGLDREATEEDIRKTFESVGEVVEVRLHMDFVTKKNKGFAFVKFSNKEQVARAIAELKNPLIRGKRCGIAPSEDNDTLFLGNICNTWTKEAVKRKLYEYGIDGVENITLVPDTQKEGLSRGFAFLEFACHSDAMLAYKRLQKPDCVFGHPERTAKVAFGEPLREADPELMAQVKSVFVDGLPPYWDEERVKEQFKGYGEIERVVLARNMPNAKRNDFGFVNFKSHEAAIACIEGTNDTELGDDGKTKIKAKVRLANPLPKTQAVKGGMSGGFRIGYAGGGFNRFARGAAYAGRGRFPSHRAGFQGARGFNFYSRGRGGRMPFAGHGNFDSSPADFRGRRPFGFRGGRWPSASGRHGGFDRGRGRAFPARRPPFPTQQEFGGPSGEGSYNFGDFGHGLKRPFSMMEHDPGFFQGGARMRPRFEQHDPLFGANRFGDSFPMGNHYSRDYYGPEYGGSGYSSFYRGGPPGDGYYF